MTWRNLLAAGAAFLAAAAAHAEENATVERLYVLDCGRIHVSDQGRYISPGMNLGQPIDLLDNCYLIKHGRDWVLWETGYPDTITGKPPAPGPLQGTRAVALQFQLERIGLTPRDIGYVIVSHTHRDHIGNVDLFPAAILLIQQAEYDFAFAPAKPPPFAAGRPVRKLEGDLDMFGDGAVTLLSTPGHTPGHQSLLVHLKNTGYVILAGDAVQTADTWTHRWAPGDDKAGVLASMDRLDRVLRQHHAQLWSNHDPLQGERQRRDLPYFD